MNFQQGQAHVNNMCTLFEQSMTLLAQTYSEILYQQILVVLASFLQDSKRAMKFHKEQSVDEYFGDQFWEFVTSISISSQVCPEMIMSSI